jgi:drug/metabolite transporter (DMT)-like permease
LVLKIERQSLVADGMLLLATVFWGLGFVASKGALEFFSCFWFMGMRFGPAFFLLFAIFRRRMKDVDRSTFAAGLEAGMIFFLAFAFQTRGLEYTSASKQAFITSTYVVMVPLLIWCWTRAFPGGVTLVSALLCCIGTWCLTSDEAGGAFNYGDFLTLCSAFLYALHVIVVGYFVRRVDPIPFAVVQIGLTALLSLATAWALEPWPGFQSLGGVPEIAFCVLFPTSASFVLQNVAQRNTPANHAVLVMSLEGVFGAWAGVWLLREILTPWMTFGCFLILGAVLLKELSPRKRVAGQI